MGAWVVMVRTSMYRYMLVYTMFTRYKICTMIFTLLTAVNDVSGMYRYIPKQPGGQDSR